VATGACIMTTLLVNLAGVLLIALIVWWFWGKH
jgi:hypothetical protein